MIAKIPPVEYVWLPANVLASWSTVSDSTGELSPQSTVTVCVSERSTSANEPSIETSPPVALSQGSSWSEFSPLISGASLTPLTVTVTDAVAVPPLPSLIS